MKSLWHKRRDREGLFYRCGLCGEDRSEIAATGAYLRLGHEVLAIICADTCVSQELKRIKLTLPYAFPELDEQGFVLDAVKQEPVAESDDALPDTSPSGARGSWSDRAALSSGEPRSGSVPPEASPPEGRNNQEPER